MADLFWDTCVFAAYLYDESGTYDLSGIEQYLSEAKAGQHKIYTSSVVFAEIAASKIRRASPGTMDDLIRDLTGSAIVVEASVNVMQLSGRLKDIKYKRGTSDKRVLSTGDAVMLATALHLEDAYGQAIDVFHTFDNAKKKFIPILSYQDWCEGLTGASAALAKRIIDMPRHPPAHPAPHLPGTIGHG
jgi:predicted nucleic acid-binding protein